MEWLWSVGGGESIFDVYSLHHVVWFIAITLLATAVFKNYAWMAAVSIAIAWEIFEHWVVRSIPDFPFAGSELFLNKWIGDPISNATGFLIAYFAIKVIRKQEHGREK